MAGDVRKRIGTFVAAHRGNAVVRRLAAWSGQYLAWHRNLDYDMRTNGELRVLRGIAATRPQVIFDVGANEGAWSRTALELCPTAALHAFELVPETARVLRERLGSHPQTHVVEAGLSDEAGEVDVHVIPGASELSSLHALHEVAGMEIRRCSVLRGDDYCAEHGIAAIDLLKIDAEGHELPVLRGFERLLADGAVRAIQFEYGYAAVYTHNLLRDLYDHLEPRGFVVGKIYPTYVAFKRWEPLDEDFIGPNYLAVRSDDQELRDLIAAARR